MTSTNSKTSDAVGIHLTDGVDNRLNVSSFSDHGTGQDCEASTAQNLDCTFDLAIVSSWSVTVRYPHSFPTRRSSDLNTATASAAGQPTDATDTASVDIHRSVSLAVDKA